MTPEEMAILKEHIEMLDRKAYRARHRGNWVRADQLQARADRLRGQHKLAVCENCGETLPRDNPGYTIEGGSYRGCWVCSEHCHHELFRSYQYPSDAAERRAEARQMGLTAL